MNTNKVKPIRDWTILTMKNGRTLQGLVVSETDTHIDIYKLPFLVNKKNIVKRESHTIGIITSQMF